MIAGIVPAAGKSTRFGRNKLALSIGGRTVLERVTDALRTGGASPVLVVLSPENAPLADLVSRAEGLPLVLEEPTPDMRATIEAGLAWLADQFPAALRGWLVCPADHPAVHPSVVRALISTFHAGPADAVYVPTYNGQRGHPVLLGWQHAERFRRFQESAGLNVYVRQQIVVEVPVNWPGILWDLDTAEDLARFQTFPGSM